ncbi:hypothetical protein V8F06_014859 [Rhypophila decipiens]
MTTGRINQVTIVRRGAANRPGYRAEEISSHWVGCGARRGPHRAGGVAWPRARLAALHIRFPPLNSPGRGRQGGWGGAESAPSTPPKRPKRRPSQEGRPLTASPTGRCPRAAHGMSGQRPGAHRAQPSAHAGYSLAPAGSSQMARAPPGERWARGTGQALGWFVSLTAPPRPKPYGNHAEATQHELGQGRQRRWGAGLGIRLRRRKGVRPVSGPLHCVAP